MSRFVTLLLASLVSACVTAETPAHLEVEKPKAVTLVPGKPVEATLAVKVTKGFHIQSNPAAEPRLIPTVVNVDPAAGLEVGPVTYPVGKPHKLESATNAITTYEGRVEFKFPLTLKDPKALTARELTGSIRFQACDDKICHFPKTTKFSLPIK